MVTLPSKMCLPTLKLNNSLAFSELSTIITRCGEGCRIIFCGDFRQTDLNNRERVGLKHFCNIIKEMQEFDSVDFTENDIVRSQLVKSFIVSQERYKTTHNILL